MKVTYSTPKIFIVLLLCFLHLIVEISFVSPFLIFLVFFNLLIMAWGLANYFGFTVNESGIINSWSFSGKVIPWSKVNGFYKVPFMKSHFVIIMKGNFFLNWFSHCSQMPTVLMKNHKEFISFIQENKPELLS